MRASIFPYFCIRKNQTAVKSKQITMKHYFTRLEEAIKTGWDRPALGNFRGELFTFGQLATQIAKFHVFFEKIGRAHV